MMATEMFTELDLSILDTILYHSRFGLSVPVVIGIVCFFGYKFYMKRKSDKLKAPTEPSEDITQKVEKVETSKKNKQTIDDIKNMLD